MTRIERRQVFDPGEIAIAHACCRTGRRCFLMGEAPVSGKNFDDRKGWIERYLVQFTDGFGIGLLCFTILSNHLHLILRSRPDVVATWSDDEAATT